VLNAGCGPQRRVDDAQTIKPVHSRFVGYSHGIRRLPFAPPRHPAGTRALFKGLTGIWQTEASMLTTSDIREHMEVMGSDGVHVGRVDRVEGGRIKLSRSDPLAEGAHHFVSMDWIERVDSHVHLNKSSSELLAQWKRP